MTRLNRFLAKTEKKRRCKLITKTKLNLIPIMKSILEKPKRKEKKNYTHFGLHTHTSVILNQKLS